MNPIMKSKPVDDRNLVLPSNDIEMLAAILGGAVDIAMAGMPDDRAKPYWKRFIWVFSQACSGEGTVHEFLASVGADRADLLDVQECIFNGVDWALRGNKDGGRWAALAYAALKKYGQATAPLHMENQLLQWFEAFGLDNSNPAIYREIIEDRMNWEIDTLGSMLSGDKLMSDRGDGSKKYAKILEANRRIFEAEKILMSISH